MGDAVRRTLGATIGGAIGFAIYWLLLERNSLEVPAAIGTGLALGAGLAARSRRLGWGVAIAVAAVALTVLVEWHPRPLRADRSLGYFVQHFGDWSPKSRIGLAVVALIGFWFGMGRGRPAPPPEKRDP